MAKILRIIKITKEILGKRTKNQKIQHPSPNIKKPIKRFVAQMRFQSQDLMDSANAIGRMAIPFLMAKTAWSALNLATGMENASVTGDIT